MILGSCVVDLSILYDDIEFVALTLNSRFFYAIHININACHSA